MLITGAAGNLGGFLGRHLLGSDLELRLMVHRTPLDYDLPTGGNATIVKADLADPATLGPACEGVDCIVHFAGVLFRPGPERFLPTTNTAWTKNLLAAAVEQGVGRFVLISFPHVEGPTSPARPATDRQDRAPVSVHAQTRLAAERAVFEAAAGCDMEPVALRVGMVYARGVLMIDWARKLMSKRLLGVWPETTPIHLISLADFLAATEAAIRKPGVRGIYNLGDDRPVSLQAFLARAAVHWGVPPPWRAPRFSFYWAAGAIEVFARLFGTRSLLTRDFVRIGMVPYVMDTGRMKAELLPVLRHPTLEQGVVEL